MQVRESLFLTRRKYFYDIVGKTRKPDAIQKSAYYEHSCVHVSNISLKGVNERFTGQKETKEKMEEIRIAHPVDYVFFKVSIEACLYSYGIDE